MARGAASPGGLVVRFEAPSRDALDRIATAPLPGAADAGDSGDAPAHVGPDFHAPSSPDGPDPIPIPPFPGTADAGDSGDAPGAPTEVFRDVYYDTPERDLRRRGATVGVRFHASGELTLAVEVRATKDGLPDAAADEGRGADPRALFAADSEAGALLRALVDPARLEPWLEVETRRRLRAVSFQGGIAAELACDERMVRDRDVSAELFEVEVRLEDDSAEARAAARGLEQAFGLTLLTGDPLARWCRSLEETEVDWLEEAVRSARRVAVVSYQGGRIALLSRGGALQVPTGPGAGIDAARQVLRERLGMDGRVRLMGTGPGSGRQPATEVWLSEDAEAVRGAADLVHLPLDELVRAAGSPAVRDDVTLAALNVLARSDLPIHPLHPDWEEGEAARDVLRAPPPLPPPASAVSPDALPPGTLLNPELSVLAFNRRVLELAGDPEVPLLERLRFLSIFGGNLDEFFRVRVAGYKREVAQGSTKLSLDGVAPREQLDAVGTRARRLADAAYRLLFDEILPALRRHGVEVVRRSGLDAEERGWLREYYDAEAHALLTPLAAGPGHPFPHIRNQRPAVVALLREPLTGGERLGVVELPDGLPRFVPLPEGGRFVALETVIVDNLHRLYPGMEVDAASTFRVTRSAELMLEGTRVADLLEAVEEEVRRRRSRPVVRVEVEDGMTPRLRELLLRELRHDAPEQAWPLGDEDVYGVEGLIDLRGVRELASLEIEGGHWPPDPPDEPLDRDEPILELLRARELLVEFPRHSFESTVERFVLEAADDPAVVAIKLALYRTNRKSRIVEALRRASSRGKQVVALVELTARFDEARNIEWARSLRRAGIHVVYGLPGLKVHAKVALVVRREEDGVRRYAYVGTGNLNATTAGAYTDLGLLTADPGITGEVADLFNVLTGAGSEPRYRLLLVAPTTMRDRFVEMVEREAAHARAGRRGHIVAKINGLADRDLIAALYGASQAGVTVDLIVRSLCALRPGVAGLSENVRVISVLGRYLEHARIFRFANGGDPEYYIGSADWRTRNLSRRVEVACPVRDPAHRKRLDHILQAQLEHPRAWELGADGTYYRRPDRAPRDPALPPPDPDRIAIITG